MANLLNEGDLLAEWIRCFGSPLHLLFPDIAAKNAKRWQDELASIYEDVSVQFALKSCKSQSLLQAMAISGAGADVASEPEMVSAFKNLVPGQRISVTGPWRSDHDTYLAATHGMMLHADCLEALARTAMIVEHVKQRGRIFLRVTPKSEPESRFGFSAEDLGKAVPILKQYGLTEIGLSFHINDYEVETRRNMLECCFRSAKMFIETGIAVNAIDIGGGFPMKYLKTYDPDLYISGHHMAGIPRTGKYPYGPDLADVSHAAAILNSVLEEEDLRCFARDNCISIYVQPGRSLLDQCGATLFKVIGTKRRARYPNIAVLDGMSFSLSENWFGSDFIPEPIILKRNRELRREEVYYLVGRSCLEFDYIRTRAVEAPYGLSSGDLIVIANTAGYQMDSNESEFHQVALPTKIAVTNRNSKWSAVIDENYQHGGVANDSEIHF